MRSLELGLWIDLKREEAWNDRLGDHKCDESGPLVGFPYHTLENSWLARDFRCAFRDTEWPPMTHDVSQFHCESR